MSGLGFNGRQYDQRPRDGFVTRRFKAIREWRPTDTALLRSTCRFNSLPLKARNAFQELSLNIRAPDEIIITALMGAMSGGSQHRVRVHAPFLEQCHVSLLLTAASKKGTGKSKVIERVFAAFFEQLQTRSGTHEREAADYASTFACWDFTRKGLQERLAKLNARIKKPSQAVLDEAAAELAEHFRHRPKAPDARLMVKKDVSISRLKEDLRGDNQSVVWVSDESHHFFDKITSDVIENVNKWWDGTILSSERLHHSALATNPHLTQCALTQPFRLRGYLEDLSVRRCGLSARYLTAMTPSRWKPPRRAIMDPSWVHTEAFTDRLRQLLDPQNRLAGKGASHTVTLTFSDEAKLLFEDLLDENLDLIDGCLRGIEDFVLKEPENIARIAAVFHDFEGLPGTLISVETLRQAIDIADWYLEQAFWLLVGKPDILQLKKMVDFLYDECYVNERHLNIRVRSEFMLRDRVPNNFILQYGHFSAEVRDALLNLLQQENAIAHFASFTGKHYIDLNAHALIYLRRTLSYHNDDDA